MLSIDDKFLEELGLGALPAEEKPKMRSHIYETLEMRVGMKLAGGMTSAQLSQFEGLVGGDSAKGREFLDAGFPDWQKNQAYLDSVKAEEQRAIQASRAPNTEAVIAEFAALKWLETNFPNYKQVVNEELDTLKAEIKTAAPQILAEISAGGQ